MTELQQALNDFVKGKIKPAIFPAKVLAVDTVAFTCDVEDTEGNEIFDIMLRATVDNADEGRVYIPKVNTWVMVGRIGDSDTRFCVLLFEELESVLWDMRTAKMQLDGAGLYLWTLAANGTLASLMQELLTALETLTVTCAAAGSPSSPPVNLATFTALKTKFNNLLKTSI